VPGGNDIRAGQAFVEITALDKTKAGLEQAERNLKHFGRTVAEFGRGLAAAGAAIFAPFAIMGRITQQIGKQINDAFNKTGESIEKLGAKMGFNEEESRKASEFAEALEEVEHTGKRIAISVASALLPVLRRFTDWFTENGVMIRAWISNNQRLIQGVALFGAGLIGAGVALIALGKIAIGVAAGMKLLTFAMTAFQLVTSLLLSPVGLLVFAIGGIAAAIIALAVDWQGLSDRWGENWAAIIAAVASGDLEGAFGVVAAGVRQEWTKLIDYLTGRWTAFKKLIAGEGAAAGPFLKDVKSGAQLFFSDIGGLVTYGMAKLAEQFGAPPGTAMLVGKDWLKESNRILDQSKKDAIGARSGAVGDLLNRAADATFAGADLGAARVRANVGAPAMKGQSGDALMGIAEQAKGLFSSSALSQSLALSDKLGERMAKGIERAAKAGEDLVDIAKQGNGLVFA
jgi:hypothetical protein